jgi:hypothetical protein
MLEECDREDAWFADLAQMTAVQLAAQEKKGA